jgi:hypothetical protein
VINSFNRFGSGTRSIENIRTLEEIFLKHPEEIFLKHPV